MGEGEVGIKNLTGPLKVLLLFLSILGLVVPSVLGWVNFDTRIDVVETKQIEHMESNKDDFVELATQIEDIEDDVIKLEKHEIERIGEYKSLMDKLDRYEATQQLILSELKRFERSL
jgi:hypothetical protein